MGGAKIDNVDGFRSEIGSSVGETALETILGL